MKAFYYTAYLLAAALALVPPTSAQQRPQGAGSPQGAIRGRVLDTASGEPVASATVALWLAADSSLVTGTVTQEDGRFALEGLRRGRYFTRISFVGFQTQTIYDVTLGGETPAVDLGTIRLAPDTRMLDEVEISAERAFMEVGIDRTVYNTRDQLVSVGGNASDVLQNIPSVEVDVDGNVSLRGSQNVAILINGRPSPMTGEALTSFLQGLPADAVERVEVIPNPSARYEPDGMAGILNIVLSQDRDLGLGGSISASAATQDNYNASGNLSFQRGRVGVFATYGFRYGSRNSEGWRFRENRFLDPSTYLNQDSFDERDRLSHTLNTSLDYRLSQHNTLTLSALLSRRSGEEQGLTAYTERDEAMLPAGRFNRRSAGRRTDLNMDYRLAFKRVVEPSKHELTAEVRYEQEWEDDFERYTEEIFDPVDAADATAGEQQTNDQDEQNREVSVQVDYIRPLGRHGRLEAGYKGELDQLDSDFYSETLDGGAWLPDLDLNNTFAYDQQIHAAYGIVAREWGRFGVQAGVRLEQALNTFTLETTNEAFENDYFSAFPSVFATYKLSDARSLKLSYSKRINRPRTRALNPFNGYDDPLFRRVGNPYLKPEYVHAFEAGYTQVAGSTSLTLTPYFRHTVDVIRRNETLDASGVSTLTFENFDSSQAWGAEVIGTIRLGRWLNAYASFNAYRVVTDGSNVDADLSNDALGFATRVNATVTLRPGLDLQASHFYRSPLNIENGRIAARQMTDLALRQKLLGDRASLSLRVRDVFGTMGFHLWRDDALFFQEFDRAFNAQQIGLTFSYNFGQSGRDRRRDRDGGRRGDEGMDDVEIEME